VEDWAAQTLESAKIQMSALLTKLVLHKWSAKMQLIFVQGSMPLVCRDAVRRLAISVVVMANPLILHQTARTTTAVWSTILVFQRSLVTSTKASVTIVMGALKPLWESAVSRPVKLAAVQESLVLARTTKLVPKQPWEWAMLPVQE
jgi:hypothetical protein